MCADDKQPSGKDKSVEDNLSGEEEEGYSTDEYSGVVEEAEMALVITPKKLTPVLSAGDAAKYVRRKRNEARKRGDEKEKNAEEPTPASPSKMAKNMERSIIAQRRKKKREQLSNPKGKANEESETMEKSKGDEKKASS
ncbi:hypothetical protein Neosp_000853 [[Neocosmospora] mangrovei]